MMNIIKPFSVAIFFFFLKAAVNAGLYDRGNGMVYDSTLRITWLQDANYAFTSGYVNLNNGHSGDMTWNEAVNWVANLEYAGFDDWRLPSAKLYFTPDCYGNYIACPGNFNGSNDASFNNTRSEVGHLFFELGNYAYHDVAGAYQPNSGVTKTSFVDPYTKQTISFLNLSGSFWEEQDINWVNFAWAFNTANGVQGKNVKNDPRFVWPVRDGDVVPNMDADGMPDLTDNCPAIFNEDQLNTDADARGDVCDNCLFVSNTDQLDNDEDGQGNVCDLDDDNDGVSDMADAFPFDAKESVDVDGDGVGNNAESIVLGAEIVDVENNLVILKSQLSAQAAGKESILLQHSAFMAAANLQLGMANQTVAHYQLRASQGAPRKELKRILSLQKKYLKSQKTLVKKANSLAKKKKLPAVAIQLYQQVESQQDLLGSKKREMATLK